MLTTTTRPRRSTSAGILVASLGGALLTQAPALAHPGHGSIGLGTGLLHPISGPDHLLAMLAVGIVAAMAGTRRIAILTPIGFLIGMVLGGALAMSSVVVPGTELAISVSVLALGAMCMAGIRRDTLLLPAAAIAFGFAHGQAHGAELPASVSPAMFVIGFLVTTAVLHLAGGLGGLALRRSVQARITAGTLICSAGVALLLGV